MNTQTLNSLETTLKATDFDALFTDVAGCAPEEFEENTEFGLSFNVETKSLQFIKYITSEDRSWVNAYEQQNPAIIVGYVGADEIICRNPAERLIEDWHEKLADI